VAAGVAAVTIRIPGMRSWSTGDLVAMAALIGATLATEAFSVKVPFGTETKLIMLTDASYAAGLLLGARPGVLTIAALLGVGVSNVARGVAPHKAAYNVGSWLIAITGAELVYGALHGVSPLVAVSAAMGMFFVLNAGTVVGVIALVTGRSASETFAPIATVEGVHMVGNLAIGIFAAALWSTAPAAMPALVAAPAACYALYRLVSPSATLRGV
jgi:hypothetical protein